MGDHELERFHLLADEPSAQSKFSWYSGSVSKSHMAGSSRAGRRLGVGVRVTPYPANYT